MYLQLWGQVTEWKKWLTQIKCLQVYSTLDEIDEAKN